MFSLHLGHALFAGTDVDSFPMSTCLHVIIFTYGKAVGTAHSRKFL